LQGSRAQVEDAVVLIRPSVDKQQKSNDFGTGFVVHSDGGRCWVLTCAHVVADLGGRGNLSVYYRGKQHPVIDCHVQPELGLDLALLSIDDLRAPPLIPHLDGRRGEAIRIPGNKEIDASFGIESLSGTLGDQIPLEIQQGPRAPIWQLAIAGHLKLEPGYSGSPVVRADTNQVLAVTSHKRYGGEHGYAIHIGNLQRIWPGLPDDLLHDDPQLPWGQRDRLKRLLGNLVANAANSTDAEHRLRRLGQLALPRFSTYRMPEASIPDLVDWLIDLGIDDGWSPILSFARQVRRLAKNPNLSNHLEGWINAAARHLQVADIDNQPLIHPHRDARSDTPSALLVAIDEPTNSKTNAHPVRCFQHSCGETMPVGLDTKDMSIDPNNDTSQTKLAVSVDRLLRVYLFDRSQTLLSFVLPDALLDLDVEHWTYQDSDGFAHSLGTELPVVVSLANRHNAMEFALVSDGWRKGWQRQSCCHMKTLAAAWSWCRTPRQIQAKSRVGVVCVALQASPRVTEMITALVGAGVTSAFWPRETHDPTQFVAAVEQRLATKQLSRLPWEVWAIRNEIWADERVDDPCNHLTLLWDDWAYRLPQTAWRSEGRSEDDPNDGDFLPGTDY